MEYLIAIVVAAALLVLILLVVVALTAMRCQRAREKQRRRRSLEQQAKQHLVRSRSGGEISCSDSVSTQVRITTSLISGISLI